jgi:hypothetical protein
MLVNPVLANGILAKGVLASGVLANGILANGVLASGILANGILANGVLASGVLANGILASGVLASGILASGVLAKGMLASGTDFTSSSNTVELPLIPSSEHVRPVFAISAHHASKLFAAAGEVGIGILANGIEPSAIEDKAMLANGELDRSMSFNVILATRDVNVASPGVLNNCRS